MLSRGGGVLELICSRLRMTGKEINGRQRGMERDRGGDECERERDDRGDGRGQSGMGGTREGKEGQPCEDRRWRIITEKVTAGDHWEMTQCCCWAEYYS